MQTYKECSWHERPTTGRSTCYFISLQYGIETKCGGCSLWQDNWQGSLNSDSMHITKQQSGLLKMQ